MFFRVLPGFIEFYWVLSGFSFVFQGFPWFYWNYWVLLGFTGFYCVLPDFTGFYRILLGFTGFYRILLSFTGFYWVFIGFTGFYLCFIGVLPGFSCVFQGFPWFYWDLTGFTGFQALQLASNGNDRSFDWNRMDLIRRVNGETSAPEILSANAIDREGEKKWKPEKIPTSWRWRRENLVNSNRIDSTSLFIFFWIISVSIFLLHKEFRFVGVVPPSYVNFKRRMNEKYLFVDLRFWSTSFQCFTFLFDCFVSFRFVQCFRLLFFRRLNYEIICLALSWHDIHFLRFANFQHVIGHDSII